MILVHKKSRGILQVKTLPEAGISPDAWWIVQERTTLGRKICRHYPCFDAVTNADGELLDVSPWGEHRIRRVDRGGPADPKRDWRHCHDPRSRLSRRKKR